MYICICVWPCLQHRECVGSTNLVSLAVGRDTHHGTGRFVTTTLIPAVTRCTFGAAVLVCGWYVPTPRGVGIFLAKQVLFFFGRVACIACRSFDFNHEWLCIV